MLYLTDKWSAGQSSAERASNNIISASIVAEVVA